MSSNDEAAIKALIATLGRPGWQDDTPKLMVGVAQRQLHGRWDTTTSNARVTIAVRTFAQSYPATSIPGTTKLPRGARSVSLARPLAKSVVHNTEPQSLMPIPYAVLCLN